MSQDTAKRTPMIALGLAVCALVVVLIAVIVVVNRDAPGAAPVAAEGHPPVDHCVLATDVVRLDSDQSVTADPRGIRVRDRELAQKLGLEADDVIVSISGRPIAGRFDLHDVIFNMSMLKVTTMYVELANNRPLVRWKLDGDLRSARYSAVPSSSSYGMLGGGGSTAGGLGGLAPDPPDPLLETIVEVDDTHFTVPRATVTAIFANPMKFMRSARVVPAVKNGIPVGMKVYAIRPSSLFAHVGIQNGDTLERVNGHPLDDASKALETYTKIRDAHELVFDIFRRGKPLTLTITVK